MNERADTLTPPTMLTMMPNEGKNAIKTATGREKTQVRHDAWNNMIKTLVREFELVL